MTRTIILFKDFSVMYYSRKSFALKDINLEVNAGETVIITGPNGSGKSTLCHAILGLIPHFYAARITGEVIVNDPIKGLETSSIGYIPQHVENSFATPYVITELSFPLEYRGYPLEEIKAYVSENVQRFNLKNILLSNPQLLSEGQKQLVATATAAIIQPEILIADEPLANLDAKNKKRVLKNLKTFNEKGKTVIVATNDYTQYLEVTDRIVILENGRIEQIISKEAAKALLESNKRSTIREKRGEEKKSSYTPTVVEFRDVEFKYEKSNGFFLEKTSFQFHEGEIIGITGENGTGKTTILKLLAGIIKPKKGKVLLTGKATSKLKDKEIAKNIGFVMQKPDIQLLEETVIKEIELTSRQLEVKIEKNAILDLLRESKLEEYCFFNPHSLSFGEKRKLTFISSILHSPKLILLDEITNGLDMKTKEWIGRKILELAKEGKTVVIATNDREWLQTIVTKKYQLEKDEQTGASKLKMEN